MLRLIGGAMQAPNNVSCVDSAASMRLASFLHSACFMAHCYRRIDRFARAELSGDILSA